MPSSKIMDLYKKHKLHSGKSGKVVRNPKQAKAILLSYLRKEGKLKPKNELSSKLTGRKKIMTKS